MSLSDADLQSLPKVELHVHLEGTITAETAIALASRHGEDAAAVLPLEDGRYPTRFRDFEHFVELYLAVSGEIRSPDDLATVAAAFARQQAAQQVRWSEATFTATTHVRNGMEPAAMWAALRDGFADVPETRVGLIVDAVRDLGPDNASETIRLVEQAEAPIVAFGLAGIEGSYPVEDFVSLRDAADRLGIGFVAHAGETGPPAEVRAALDVLRSDRIGHGVAAIRDPELLARLVRNQTVLEICPTSNVVIGVVDDLDHHPLPQLIDAGVAVTVNSDDPPFFGTTLTEELGHAARLAGLGREDLVALQRRAVDASYAPPDLRSRIHAELDGWQPGAAGTTV